MATLKATKSSAGRLNGRALEDMRGWKSVLRCIFQDHTYLSFTMLASSTMDAACGCASRAVAKHVMEEA